MSETLIRFHSVNGRVTARIEHCSEDQAELAAYIVLAVNAHPALEAACKHSAWLLRDAMEWCKAYGHEPKQIRRLEIQAEDNEAAPAKAKGQL